MSKDTIALWIETVLVLAGIDVSKFEAYNAKMASPVKPKLVMSLLCTSIVETVSWRSPDVFSVFCNKPVARESRSFA